MKQIISERFASHSLLFLLVLFLLFHFLIMLNIIPYQIVWGGRLTSQEQMLRSETVSVIINMIMICVAITKLGLFKAIIHPIIIKTLLWIMFGLFLLNTLGNLFSINEFEKLFFTPVTLLLSLLCLRLAISKNN